jgi:uncharacterized protein involved in exopolysaccharide biosynthesis
MENRLPDFNLNGTNIVQMVWSRRIVFIVVGIVAFIVSLVISLLITPQFKSTAILIPSIATQASKDVLVASRANGLTVFGDDEEVEHLLQILSSETLRRNIIIRHNLFDHYKIEPDLAHAWFNVNEVFSSNVSFSPSRYRSVRIEVLDESPEMAAKIANSIVIVADSLTRESKRVVAQKALDMLLKLYEKTSKDYFTSQDSLSKIMSSYGLIDLSLQVKEVTRVQAEAIAAGNSVSASRLEKYIDNLTKHAVVFHRHNRDVNNLGGYLNDMLRTIHILQIEAEGVIPSQFVIDWAQPSDKKAKPKKMIIIAVATLSALFFSVFLFILIDFFKKSLKLPQRVEE